MPSWPLTTSVMWAATAATVAMINTSPIAMLKIFALMVTRCNMVPDPDSASALIGRNDK